MTWRYLTQASGSFVAAVSFPLAFYLSGSEDKAVYVDIMYLCARTWDVAHVQGGALKVGIDL